MINILKIKPAHVVDIRSRLLERGWYERCFPNSGCTAMNPVYENFSLGISERWYGVGKLPDGTLLEIFPSGDSLLDTLTLALGELVVAEMNLPIEGK